MRNYSYLVLITLYVCFVFSCKKDAASNKSANTALIVGKWLVTQQNTKVYDLNTNVLLKDTTLYFTGANLNLATYNIYNADATAYVTTMPYKKAGSSVPSIDTTSYLHYTILGSSLMLKPNGGGSETDPIIQLTQTNLVLENTQTSRLNAGWGLDINTNYLLVQDSYYTKQ
ncbi:MAG: hypothetical protein JWQ79_279 [Mucilaginibacter sp.]|jgi:hypothetical protein|nr:hypothetical protein [Mucilaginibacter sp.]